MSSNSCIQEFFFDSDKILPSLCTLKQEVRGIYWDFWYRIDEEELIIRRSREFLPWSLGELLWKINNNTSCEGSGSYVPVWLETADQSSSCLLVWMKKQDGVGSSKGEKTTLLSCGIFIGKPYPLQLSTGIWIKEGRRTQHWFNWCCNRSVFFFFS